MLNKIEQTAERTKQFRNNLWEFLKEYSVIGLAIGMVVGQITKDLVDSIVKGILTPIINLVIPGEEANNLVLTIGQTNFDFAPIISALLTFIIVLIALYVLVKKILKAEKEPKEKN
ncbi:MAG: MscL family protein [Patescibacteria group bacterium]|nr:MscL family protein [Patescibacteria group bacterium]MDD4611365.1 MscL family protein [Patescibacteria group bacterium]